MKKREKMSWRGRAKVEGCRKEETETEKRRRRIGATLKNTHPNFPANTGFNINYLMNCIEISMLSHRLSHECIAWLVPLWSKKLAFALFPKR